MGLGLANQRALFQCSILIPRYTTLKLFLTSAPGLDPISKNSTGNLHIDPLKQSDGLKNSVKLFPDFNLLNSIPCRLGLFFIQRAEVLQFFEE